MSEVQMTLEEARQEAIKRWGTQAIAGSFQEISKKFIVSGRTKNSWGIGDSFDHAFKVADAFEEVFRRADIEQRKGCAEGERLATKGMWI